MVLNIALQTILEYLWYLMELHLLMDFYSWKFTVSLFQVMLKLPALPFKDDCILELDWNYLQDLKIWNSHQNILHQEEGVTAVVILMK